MSSTVNFIIALLTQAVFIDRLRVMYADRGSWLIVGVLGTLSAAGFAFGMATMAYLAPFRATGGFSASVLAFKLRSVGLRPASLMPRRCLPGLSIPSLIDLVITALMLWRLSIIEVDSDRTARQIVRRLARVTLQSVVGRFHLANRPGRTC